MCWGGPNIVPGPEWTKTGIIFHQPGQLQAFGLQTQPGAVKAFQMVLQALVLKQLLFGGNRRNSRRQVHFQFQFNYKTI